MEENKLINVNYEDIKNLIFTIRGKQVILDSDIAKQYEVETKRVNEAVKRNLKRFPQEFC
ncbi:MAG: ORF6N domain-containing protein, partial [Clostridia bacterium]|nr:ORF6N domain-containing protein [Clostridia bacterium]